MFVSYGLAVWQSKNSFGRAALYGFCSFLVTLCLFQPSAVAFADTPAVTDFGQIESTPASTSAAGGFKQAIFLTLYPDGSGHSEVRGVRDDTENAMLGDHPSWQLDHSLTWFVQMPVYVRQLSRYEAAAGTSSV